MKEKVMQWIDEHSDDVANLLSELIQINSENPWFYDFESNTNEEEIQLFISDFLKQMNYDVRTWTPDIEDYAAFKGKPGYVEGRDYSNRPVVCGVKKGSSDGQSLLLTGHADVVKSGEGWTKDPCGGDIIDGYVWGRGAVDMKGGIAAMLMAAKAIHECDIKLKGDLAISTFPDEEAGGLGALSSVEEGYKADAVIMTECTGLKVCPMCMGIIWGKIKIQGRAGHIEMKPPHWTQGGAVDAIELARLYLYHIDRLNKEWELTKTHPLLDMPCQMLVAQISAGEYPSAYANSAEIIFNVQYLPSDNDENHLGGNIIKEIETFIEEVAQTDEWLKENPPELEILLNTDGEETPLPSSFVDQMVQTGESIGYQLPIKSFTGHSDIGWFIRKGMQTVNFGPGSAMYAHQPDERLAISELIDATKIIAATIIDWCGVERD